MRPVKASKKHGTPTAERLAKVCTVLGPVGKKLPLAWLADLASIPRSTLKNAASRDSLSYDVAWQIAGLFDDDRAATVEWLRKGTPVPPTRPRMVSMGSSETHSGGVSVRHPDRAERLAGIAARAFALVVRAAERLEGGGGATAGQRQLGEALLAFASDLMRKGFVHTPALIAVAQRLIEGTNPPDVATIAGAVHDVLAASPRARTAEGRRDLALSLTGLAKQLAEARLPQTHGLLDLARLLLHEESAIL
ncbi:MAG: hypothetical protein ACREMN_02310 [Gemmatimonadales bacterium]